MSQKKIAVITTIITSILITLALFANPARATTVLDHDTGNYIYVEAAVAGNVNYQNGRVYSPAAYAKAVIQTTLPNNHGLYLYYHFEWADNATGEVHIQEGVAYNPNGTAGFSIRIDATGLPSPVRYIAADARAGFGGDWDTRLVSASLPFL